MLLPCLPLQRSAYSSHSLRTTLAHNREKKMPLEILLDAVPVLTVETVMSQGITSTITSTTTITITTTETMNLNKWTTLSRSRTGFSYSTLFSVQTLPSVYASRNTPHISAPSIPTGLTVSLWERATDRNDFEGSQSLPILATTSIFIVLLAALATLHLLKCAILKLREFHKASQR